MIQKSLLNKFWIFLSFKIYFWSMPVVTPLLFTFIIWGFLEIIYPGILHFSKLYFAKFLVILNNFFMKTCPTGRTIFLYPSNRYRQINHAVFNARKRVFENECKNICPVICHKNILINRVVKLHWNDKRFLLKTVKRL